MLVSIGNSTISHDTPWNNLQNITNAIINRLESLKHLGSVHVLEDKRCVDHLLPHDLGAPVGVAARKLIVVAVRESRVGVMAGENLVLEPVDSAFKEEEFPEPIIASITLRAPARDCSTDLLCGGELSKVTGAGFSEDVLNILAGRDGIDAIPIECVAIPDVQ